MSMYNLIHGENPVGPALIDLLQKVQPVEIGRYRDAWVEHRGDALMIRVHTRNGGGNRASHDDPSMQAHPWYVEDSDLNSDTTYADYWFLIDPKVVGEQEMRILMSIAQDPVDMDARWDQAIESLKRRPIKDNPQA